MAIPSQIRIGDGGQRTGDAETARRRILVVEDNADGRELLRIMLELLGHEVHEAGDGEEAVRRAIEL